MAAPVGALLHGLVKAPAGARVVSVLSGGNGNVNVDQLRGLSLELNKVVQVGGQEIRATRRAEG